MTDLDHLARWTFDNPWLATDETIPTKSQEITVLPDRYWRAEGGPKKNR